MGGAERYFWILFSYKDSSLQSKIFLVLPGYWGPTCRTPRLLNAIVPMSLVSQSRGARLTAPKTYVGSIIIGISCKAHQIVPSNRETIVAKECSLPVNRRLANNF